MKKIIMFLLFVCNLNAQITSHFTISPTFSVSSIHIPSVGEEYLSNKDTVGKVYIDCDSLTAIKILFKEIHRLKKEIDKSERMQLLYINLVNASIDLINDMPTYYRTNSCFYDNYIRNIKLNKLSFYKVKPYQFKPCTKNQSK